ncbi:hypothetical protein RB195_016397 [Necator americanus]|uniref:Uncharacterized protein n=1 Tax=Necator americanus TaxID=51031 RepID=A0ABR1E9C2_NECAM
MDTPTCSPTEDSERSLYSVTVYHIRLKVILAPLYGPHLSGVVHTVSPESDSSIRMYNCAKEDINAKYQVIHEAEEAKKFMFFIILASVLGGVGIIVLLAILIPIFIKIRRYRHKKWLAETWEERVRKAATELNKQEGKEPNKVSTGRTRAERKAKKMAESKESKEKGSKEQGSKESVERGSKDMGSNENFQNEIFPSAFGPNERRMSVDGIGSRENIEGGKRW